MLSVFTTILEMSLTASVVILTVLLARALLSKAPKKYAYLLWLVVAFRLCVPFSFESSISIFNTAGAIPTFDIETSTQETVSEDTAVSVTPETSETVSVPNTPVTPDTNEGTASVPEYQPPIHTPVTPNEGTVTVPEGNTTPETPVTPPVNQTPEVSAPAPVTPDETPDETPMVPPVQNPVETPVAPEVPTANQMYTVTVVLTSVWALGVICMLGCGAVSYIKLKKRLQNAVLLYDNVYGSDRIGSPFALGVFRPRIYIPFGLNEEAQAYILAHERYHLKRLDHLVKPLSFAILCVHWFNPLCWFAFSRMSLDMELSCDERVLKQFGDENMKKKYTKTLLDFATDRRYPSPAPISFSEGAGAKTRIKHALYWKKPRFWVSAIAVLLCAVILVACASNAVSNDPSDNSEDTNSDRIIDFGDTPYQFTFASNGDGTCVITDIKTDFDRTEKFDLIIPEKSSDGDTVVEVDMSALGDYKDVFNVPGALKKETFASIIDRIRSSEFKGESGITAEKAADIVDAFYGHPISQPSAEHIDEFSYVVLEFLISVEEASRISAYLTDFIGYTAKDCYADCLAVMDLDTSEETAALLGEKAFRFFYHDVSNIQKVVLPSKEITVRHNELAIPFALADGTVFEPKYANPVSVGYLTDDVDLFSPDTLHFAEKQSVGDETIMVTTSKTVSKLCFFALDSTDGETFTVENVLLSGVVLTDAQTLVIDTVISETFPNRGIGFLGTDGKMHYYAICWSGFDGSLSLSEITDKVDFPLTLSIRSATDEDKHNDNYLHFTAPGLPVSYDLIIESNQTLENLNVCKIDADDYSDENGWLYTAEPFDTLLGSLTPDKALHLTVYPASIVDTYGIFFKDKNGALRYFAIYESELDGAISLVEITSQIRQGNSQDEPSFSIPEQSTATEYPLANGTLYLVDQEDQEKQLFINYDNGSTVILAEGTNFQYLSVSPDGKKIIWNDYEWEYNATAYLFDTETGRLHGSPMDDLGENYTPSFMGWLDSRYFLFVVQFDHGTIVRGGDIYIYDTQTDEYRLLIKAGSLDAHTLMIHAFEVQGDDVVFHAYDYDYDTDQYTSTQKTWSKNVLFACALEKSSLSWKIDLTPIAPFYIEQVSKNEPLDFYDQEEIDRYGSGEIVHTLRLTFNRPVTQFSFIKLDSADVLTYLGPVSQDQTNLSFDAGDTYTVATYIKDIHDNRGIALSFEDGVLHYYAIRCDMIFGTFGVAEITDQITQKQSDVPTPLDCPVEVVPTDKEPSITFDRHAQEVFEFTFTKDVKGFAIVKIDTGVAYDITVDPLNKPADYKAGDTLVYAMYINDIGDSRGFVLIGEDGKLHYYALRGPDMAGFSSDYKVIESTDHPLLTVDGKTPDFNP